MRSKAPKKFGDWTTTAAVWASTADSSCGRVNLPGGRVGDFHQFHVLVLDVGPKNLAIFRVQRSRQHHATAPGDAHGHQRGFGGGGRAVVERSVADLLPGELRHHGLKLEHRLQGSLGDFRLVGGVGGKELAAREHGVNHHGAIVRIGSRAQQGNILAAALGRRLLEELQDFGFGERPGKVQFSFEPQVRGDLREEFIDVSVAGGRRAWLAGRRGVRQVAH